MKNEGRVGRILSRAAVRTRGWARGRAVCAGEDGNGLRDGRNEGEKGFPNKEADWKPQWPDHGGTGLWQPREVWPSGEKTGPLPRLPHNSLSTSTGRWPIMAARC